MDITERQKKFLRRAAHNLKPVISIGDKGVTPALLKELDRALEHHELIKLRIRSGDRDARNASIAELVATTGAVLISRVGNIAALYRPQRKNPKIVLPKSG